MCIIRMSQPNSQPDLLQSSNMYFEVCLHSSLYDYVFAIIALIFFQAKNIAGATLDYNRKSMLKEFLLKHFPSGTFNLHIRSTLHATA